MWGSPPWATRISGVLALLTFDIKGALNSRKIALILINEAKKDGISFYRKYKAKQAEKKLLILLFLKVSMHYNLALSKLLIQE